jgi:uncharacterized protein (DUF433 family)
MKQLNFAQTAPLNQDSEGSIRLTGSRVTLDTLVAAFKKGNTAEQIQDSFPSLSLAQIYGAIAWYLDHQAEAEDYLNEREAEAEAIRQEIENQPGQGAFRETMRQRREHLSQSEQDRLRFQPGGA